MSEDDVRKRTVARYRAFAEQTGFLLQWIHRRCQREVNEALRPLGVEARHVGVLALLADSGPLSQRELIDMLSVDKSSMVHIVDDLERRGLAQRRSAPRDRRAYAVSVTDAGRECLVQAQAIITAVNDRLFGWLGAEDREKLHAMLWRLIEGVPASQS